MHRNVSCPSCDEEIRVPEEFLGRNMKCTFCGAPLFAPSESKPAKAATSEPVILPQVPAPKMTDPILKEGSISPEPRLIIEATVVEEADLPTVKPVYPVRREQPLLTSGRYGQRVGLFLLAVVPLGILLLMVGGAKARGMDLGLPLVVGAGIAFGSLVLCIIIAVIEVIPVWRRALLSMIISGLGYSAGLFMLAFWLSTGEKGTLDWFTWKEFSPADGGFRVEMPGTPLPQTENIRGGNFHELKVDADNAYGVGYLDISPNEVGLVPVEERFINARNKMLGAKSDLRLTAERPLKLADIYPGREYEFDISAPKNGKVVVRIYVVKLRVYLLIVGGTRLHPSSRDTTRFLNSFKLISASSR